MNRRQFLTSASVTVTVASISGCLGNALGGEPEVFKKITAEGTSLVVTFAEDSDIQSVNLIASDGSQFNGTNLNAGEYQAAINLIGFSFGNSIKYIYTPGKYTLVAVDSEGTEYEREVIVRPNTSVADISFLRNHLTDSYEKSLRYTAPVVTFDNTADNSSDAIVGPDIVTGSGVSGSNIPQSKTVSTETANGLKPVTGSDDNSGYLLLGADTTRRAITSYQPFMFSKSDGYGNDGYESAAAIRRQWAGETVNAMFTSTNLTSIATDFTVKYAGTAKENHFIVSGTILYFDNSKIVNTATRTTTTR
jgi:hypothetical protein